MNRRALLSLALSTPLLVALGAPSAVVAAAVSKTRWRVRTSIGLEAIALLGALAGGSLYLEYYAADAEAFGARLPDAVRTEIRTLWQEATDDGFGLLGPNLAVFLAGEDIDQTIATLVSALRARETVLLPPYRASAYWNERDWAWFDDHAERIGAVLRAMDAADFSGFLAERTTGSVARLTEVQRALDGFDVISWQEKLTGRTFDPVINIVLVHFAKPHGIKVQGQTFLQATDYDTATTVRIAAHEMLHPPVAMDGPAAKAALTILERDPLLVRIVRDHDPKWGYTTLEGVLNEDLTQALDQLISEALGVARNPADRWRRSDDGFHVLAGALYGLLRQDRWTETGGSIDAWLLAAARSGRLDPAVLHPVAARVLERPVDRLWPLDAPAAQSWPLG